MNKVTVFWHRRDIRTHDNVGLFHALQFSSAVLPVFIFDKDILEHFNNPQDPRLTFLHREVAALKLFYQSLGSDLLVVHSDVITAWRQMQSQYTIEAVYTNHDYEPQSIERDTRVRTFLATHSIPLHTFKDQCIFEKFEVVKEDQTPYTVFTPYSKKWKAALESNPINISQTELYFGNLLKVAEPSTLIQLKALGYEETNIALPLRDINTKLISSYNVTRDFPSLRGTSRLGIHLRFGTISIRELVLVALKTNETYLNELIWREFYMQILFHFPHVVTQSFKPAYDRIQWRNDAADFERWCKGQTGYPLVDAGMRELNQTGFIHNRSRMVVASFLTKHLLIDWRWGEHYFAQKLLDYDLSANNGGWQWAAGSGTDAAPYFRIFNPSAQAQNFDKDGTYIQQWVPELKSLQSYQPMVDHTFARNRCLAAYAEALKKEHIG